MDEKNNGGPAFPREDYQTYCAPGQSGMTLRDYFAAKALPSILAQDADGIQAWAPDASNLEGTMADAWARDAYAIADAMLKARAA